MSEEEMMDLVYAGQKAEAAVQERFPHFRIEDASDEVHGERFAVFYPRVDKAAYDAFLLETGLILLSLNAQLDDRAKPLLRRGPHA